MNDLWKYLGLGLQLAATIALFVFVGWWLDRRFGSFPWSTLVLGVLGLAAGMYHFLRAVLP